MCVSESGKLLDSGGGAVFGAEEEVVFYVSRGNPSLRAEGAAEGVAGKGRFMYV